MKNKIKNNNINILFLLLYMQTNTDKILTLTSNSPDYINLVDIFPNYVSKTFLKKFLRKLIYKGYIMSNVFNGVRKYELTVPGANFIKKLEPIYDTVNPVINFMPSDIEPLEKFDFVFDLLNKFKDIGDSKHRTLRHHLRLGVGRDTFAYWFSSITGEYVDKNLLRKILEEAFNRGLLSRTYAEPKGTKYSYRQYLFLNE